MGLYTSGRLNWAEEQVGLRQVKKSEGALQVRTCKKAERTERTWDDLGAVGKQRGKAGEWKEMILHRMELYYISPRKFSLLRGFFTWWEWKRGAESFGVKERTINEVLAKLSMVWGLEAESMETSEEVVVLVMLVWGDGADLEHRRGWRGKKKTAVTFQGKISKTVNWLDKEIEVENKSKIITNIQICGSARDIKENLGNWLKGKRNK